MTDGNLVLIMFILAYTLMLHLMINLQIKEGFIMLCGSIMLVIAIYAFLSTASCIEITAMVFLSVFLHTVLHEHLK